jgi:prevent-host-death family protein
MPKIADREYSTTEARKHLSDIIAAAHYGSERTKITRNGKPMAAVVSLEDLEAMEALEDMMDLKEAKKRLKEHREEGGATSLEAFRKELQHSD